jgi:group I intron endonuclease
MGYIYKITNRISGKIYIGKTVQYDPVARWKGHKYMFRQTKGGCPALRDAVRKYGIDAFVFEILIICFDDDCDRWEIEYIKKFDCIAPKGYNILEGGQGGAGFRGKTHSAETVEKIQASLKKWYDDPEYIERLRENARRQMANVDKKEFGKKVIESEKYKKALEEGRVGGRAHKDGTVSEQTKDKIRKGVLKYYEEKGEGNKCNIEKQREAMAKAKGRKVDQFDKDGNFIAMYDSISDAARNIGVSEGCVRFVLIGKNKTGGGYIWKYHIEPGPKMENEIIYDS